MELPEFVDPHADQKNREVAFDMCGHALFANFCHFPSSKSIGPASVKSFGSKTTQLQQ